MTDITKQLEDALRNLCGAIEQIPEGLEGYLLALDKPLEESRQLLNTLDQQGASTAKDDPCPGCRPGGWCRTPKCGRLKLQAAPSEQPAQGEREAFEAWFDDKWHGRNSDLPYWEAWQARAALAQRPALVALTDEQIEQGRRETFSTENPFCPCTDKTMRKAVRWAERAHGITAPVNAVNSPKAQEEQA